MPNTGCDVRVGRENGRFQGLDMADGAWEASTAGRQRVREGRTAMRR